MEPKKALGIAIRLARLRRGLTQEDFSLVSSRTYVSLLERGETSPTVEKLETICDQLGIHPATLVAYSQVLSSEEAAMSHQIVERISREILELDTMRREQPDLTNVSRATRSTRPGANNR